MTFDHSLRPGDRGRPSMTEVVRLAAAVATATVTALHFLHAGAAGSQHGLTALARDAVLVAPLAVVALEVAYRRARRDPVHRALSAATLFGLLFVPAAAVNGARLGIDGLGHALLEGIVALAAATLVLVTHAALGADPAVTSRPPAPLRRVTAHRRTNVRHPLRTRLAALAATFGVLVTGLPLFPAATPAVAQDTTPATCDEASYDRYYDIAAISLDIPYNRWGDVNPNGMMYVLQSDKHDTRNWSTPVSGSDDRRLRPRPLVLRANEGECVKLRLTNELNATPGEGLPHNPRASISVRGVPYDAQDSGGGAIGFNDDTSVAIGESTTAFWGPMPEEGIYFFNDQATPAGSEGDGGSLGHGLFGAIVSEPAGSTWFDPVSGQPLYSAGNASEPTGTPWQGGTTDQSGELYINAVIKQSDGQQFRESVQIAQDEIPGGLGFGFNYGAEQSHHRASNRCPDCVGEETSLSSWPYGDPALVKLASGPGPWLPDTSGADPEKVAGECDADTLRMPQGVPGSCWTANVTHSYANDNFKLRFGMAGVKETHVFHLHAHTWLAEDKDVGAAGTLPTQPSDTRVAQSTTIDSQTVGPTEVFTADLLFGAGSKPGTIGDSIFHCHLYPHFAAGFWALLRTHDVFEDGTGTTPDGIRVAQLLPLSNDSSPPPAPTALNPGFPRFVPGQFGWRAPQPPLGISQSTAPTLADPTGGDNPLTVVREDLTTAPRIVAGQPLVPSTATELNVMNTLSGGASKPGAPFVDPCPTGAREVTYNIAAIQLPIVYNSDGWTDRQGRILVPLEDAAAILNGDKQPEPLFARVNAGDCVNWNLTNLIPNWFGDDEFLKLAQTNMFGQHVHLVKFDVLASDGASNGWNYQQAAFTSEQTKFNADVLGSIQTCDATDCRIDDPTEYTPGGYDPAHGTKELLTAGGLGPYQTIHERWYADYELRTAFTHDHHFAVLDQNRGQYGALVVEPSGFDFRDPRSGEYHQPLNSSSHGTPCVNACNGSAVGAAMDAIGPGPNDDFRDFGLAVADFTYMWDENGDGMAISPPFEPEEAPDEDPGGMSVNYRTEPLRLRRNGPDGNPADPAYLFSSWVHGDPSTPVLQTYSGDQVRIRLVQGAHEEQHTVAVHGMKWRREPNDPDSPFVSAQPLGVSEAFNFEAPTLQCGPDEDCQGDYLYGGTAIDDLYAGVWGLMRVNGGKIQDLKPLPDNQPGAERAANVRQTGNPPPRAVRPGNPCPSDATVRTFDVVALDVPVVYNSAGDHDPYGLIYALRQDVAAIRAGDVNPEPLTIRANEGDCIEVTLTNEIDPNGPFATKHAPFGTSDGDAVLPLEPDGGTPAGLRVSLHPQMVTYDVRGSDGATVGFNRDQTVGPGQSILYRWWAEPVTPGEIGATNLVDFGDVIGHRHHGLFAGLNIEPAGATYHDPVTGKEIASGGSADIRVAGKPDFREFTVFFQDGLNLRDVNGTIIGDTEEPHPPPLPGEPPEPAHPEGLDAEDSGEKGFNYRSEPFRLRLGGTDPVGFPTPDGQDFSDIYNSRLHGDPSTPVFRAYNGDDIRMRVLQPTDKPRQHAFQLGGHSWLAQPDDPDSRRIATQGGFSTGQALNVHTRAASAVPDSVGDFLYVCAVGFFHRSGGLWGLLRVYPQPGAANATQPTALGTGPDNPRAGGHPILPLDIDDIVATVYGDTNGNGTKDADEATLAGATVAVTSTGAPAPVVTGSDGVARFPVPAGNHDLEVTPPRGWQAASRTVTMPSGGAVVRTAIGLLPVVTPAPTGGGGGGGGGGGALPPGTEPPGDETPLPGDPTSPPAERLACPEGSVPDAGYRDVPAFSAHAAAIDCVAWWGIARGITPSLYAPAGLVSRAQMASLLVRLLEADGTTLPEGPDRFRDDDGNVHEASINKLAQAGIARGTGAGRFDPLATVSRAQLASFLAGTYASAAGAPLPPGPDAFDDDDGNVHEDKIDRVAAAGIASGTGDRQYEPGKPVRRDQMASFLSRLLNRLVAEGHVSQRSSR